MTGVQMYGFSALLSAHRGDCTDITSGSNGPTAVVRVCGRKLQPCSSSAHISSHIRYYGTDDRADDSVHDHTLYTQWLHG